MSQLAHQAWIVRNLASMVELSDQCFSELFLYYVCWSSGKINIDLQVHSVLVKCTKVQGLLRP